MRFKTGFVLHDDFLAMLFFLENKTERLFLKPPPPPSIFWEIHMNTGPGIQVKLRILMKESQAF